MQSLFEKWQSEFDLIIEISGNHEFYSRRINDPMRLSQTEATNHQRLDNSTFEMDGVRFVCSTLWSYIPDSDHKLLESKLNDYHQIQNETGIVPITTLDTNLLHNQAVTFLEAELTKPYAGKTVVVTHHMPSNKCIVEKWQGNKFAAGYASNCEHLIGNADLWVFGHQHETVDTEIDGCRLVANPLGYVGEETQPQNWRPDWVIEI